MSAAGRVRQSVLVVALSIAVVAHAWESQCRPALNGDSLDQSVCEPADAAECAAGLDSARGFLYGEHALITRDALVLAGLRAFAEATAIPPYYAADAFVRPFVKTLAPTGTGQMQVKALRPNLLPELSQVPDVSYGLSDYVLANEYCVAANPPSGKAAADEIDACHNFKPHMGSINSTHFSPQNHAVYDLYHQLAIQVARRCKLMQTALDPAQLQPGQAPHPLHDYQSKVSIPSCEMEALSLQSVASHYIEDAWSTGHMWERWGSPVYATDADPIVQHDRQVRAAIVAVAAGLQHGWRSVARGVDLLAGEQHDQLCMPGASRQGEPQVEWTYPDPKNPESANPGPRHAGGGDLYYKACNAGPNGASLEGGGFDVQQKRMLTCLALGFREVYAAGPKTLGETRAQRGIDGEIANSTDSLCWDQRATNQSMWLGLGITDAPGSKDPWWMTKVVVGGSDAAFGAPLGAIFADPNTATATETQLQQDLGAFVNSVTKQAVKHANGTESSTATAAVSVLDSRPNSAYVATIQQGQVEYLEVGVADLWRSALSGSPCAIDSDCAIPGSYCQPATPGVAAHCEAKENAILGAWREGETPAWCDSDGASALEAAAQACHAGAGQDACDACVTAVLPHLRNACDAGSYAPRAKALADRDARLLDHRSLCDVYESANLALPGSISIYRPYDPDHDDPAVQALEWCRSGKSIADTQLSYGFDEAPPQHAVDLHGADQAGLCPIRNTCGAGLATHWFHFADTATEPTHTHTLQLQLQPLKDAHGDSHLGTSDGIEWTFFTGPGCAKPFNANVVAVDPRNLQAKITVVQGTPLDVCARVKAAAYSAWTSYSLSAGPNCQSTRYQVFDLGPGQAVGVSEGQVAVTQLDLGQPTWVVHSSVRSAHGSPVSVATLGGPSATAYSISHGQVAGTSDLAKCRFDVDPCPVYAAHGFVWSQVDGIADLGLEDSIARGIDHGVVGGLSTVHDGHGGHDEAFSWTKAGGIVSLGLEGAEESRGYGIGDGLVVGFVGRSGAGAGSWAYAWGLNGGAWNLGALSGSDWSEALSASGDTVAGWFLDQGMGLQHAFIWNLPEGLIDLGPMDYGVYISQGQVVSTRLVLREARDGFDNHVMRWTQARGWVDITPDGWTGAIATGIDEDGEVCGSGSPPGRPDARNAFLLKPIPN